MACHSQPYPRQGRCVGTEKSFSSVVRQCTRSASTSSQLSSISLASILSGNTCSPISLSDFEAYLTFQEHTLENLHFVVWFQDYRQRFFALPAELRAASPGPSKFTFALPTPARIARRATDSKLRAEHCRSACGQPSTTDASQVTPHILESLAPRRTQSRARSCTAFSFPPSPLPRRFTDDSRTVPPVQEQPFRQECLRIVATFLRPGALKELPLDPTVRDTVIRDLTWNTHPDVFLPAYEEMCDMLETTSLPRFLAGATANINYSKQMFFYAVGILDLFLAVAVAVALIMTVPAPPQRSRAWRLFAVPLAAVGGIQVYSAYRGICSQVWGRGSMQLRVWELQEMDEEATVHWGRVLSLDDTRATNQESDDTNTRTLEDPQTDVFCVNVSTTGIAETTASDADAVVADMDPIAPFAAITNDSLHANTHKSLPPSTLPFVQPELVYGTSIKSTSRPVRLRLRGLTPIPDSSSEHASSTALDSDVDTKSVIDEQNSLSYRRPPIFGPERVVLDPRIQAVHRQVMRELLIVGFLWTLAFTAIVLSVPGVKH